jgi:hypothetical protein
MKNKPIYSPPTFVYVYLAIVFLILAAITCNAQKLKKNTFTTYYGIENSVTLEYGRYFTKDDVQLVGFDVGVGYINREDATLKTTVGIRGLVLTKSEWNLFYKMGILLYDVESYDFFVGIGVEKNRLHVATKINMVQLIGFNHEWIEFGIGFNF